MQILKFEKQLTIFSTKILKIKHVKVNKPDRKEPRCKMVGNTLAGRLFEMLKVNISPVNLAFKPLTHFPLGIHNQPIRIKKAPDRFRSGASLLRWGGRSVITSA